MASKDKKQSIIKRVIKIIENVVGDEFKVKSINDSDAIEKLLDENKTKKTIVVIIKTPKNIKFFKYLCNNLPNDTDEEDKKSFDKAKHDCYFDENVKDKVDFIIYRKNAIIPFSFNSDLSYENIKKCILRKIRCSICDQELSKNKDNIRTAGMEKFCKYCTLRICFVCFTNLLNKSVVEKLKNLNCPQCGNILYTQKEIIDFFGDIIPAEHADKGIEIISLLGNIFAKNNKITKQDWVDVQKKLNIA
jgi:hypothetical protein